MTTLLSNDGQSFQVSAEFAKQCSKLIENTQMTINVPAETLERVIEYDKHVSDYEWTTGFGGSLDKLELFSITMAANQLGFRGLETFACQCIATRIRGKTPKEQREWFGVHIDKDGWFRVDNEDENEPACPQMYV